jgi:cell division protein FtsL
MFVNDNILILYFHFDFDAEYEQYRKYYAQTHDIVFVELNFEREINYAINKFLNICVNRFVFVEFVVIMIVIVFIFAFAIKNLIIIQMKKCTHCERYYHVKNECRDKHSHLKRNHQSRKNQSNRDDRNNKRRRRNDKNNDNDNDNDNDNRNDDDENAEKSHKLYIVMTFETLSTMNVMLVQIIFWVLNNACS